ncbi:hypothetical protein [Geobacter grbiciae]|uniref:hypothetical protein n=1 Tax=Geobacter grbiciae TaxID=155042 RepID=UPI001C00A05B|nr:hypothetical protein [Geobacter grbiciae]MBT1074250.1 hypothetical protein [Geobacter grbiciae]
MKGIVRIFALLALVTFIAAPVVSQAAGKKVKSEVVMKIGNKVHLFHSGTADVKKEIALNDVIPVYRQTGKTAQLKEVGQVKVLAFIDEHHFEAEIVKGEIKVGDIAKKESAGLLVQPAK